MQDKIIIKAERERDNEYPIQSPHHCGGFVTWFVLRYFLKISQSPREITSRIPWRIPFSGTLPCGIVSFLKRNRLSVAEKYYRDSSDEMKIDAVSAWLGAGQLVIILGKQRGQQHYVVVVQQFGQNEFSIYDPLVGYSQWTESDLLRFWSGGGVMGFYTSYVIIVGQVGGL